MKYLIILSVILSVNLYPETGHLASILEKAQKQTSNDAMHLGVFLQPKKPKKFLEKMLNELIDGQRISLVFYPKRSFFENIVKNKESFISLEELKQIEKQHPYKIVHMQINAPIAHFDSVEELKEFVNATFGTTLTNDAMKYYQGKRHIHLPTRCVVAILEKCEDSF